MRADSAAFIEGNTSLNKEPRYIVEVAFDDANTDLVYFTSHADAPLPAAATSYDGVLIKWKNTSQKLNPEKANAQIGKISFDLLDKDQTIRTLLSTKHASDKNLKGKRIRAYMAYDGMAWADVALIQTQIIDEVSTKDGVYSFTCSDIQRALRKKVFELAKTTMQSSITATDTTVTVYSTAEFSTVAHGTSYSDAPSSTVGYIKIEDEIIRYTGKTATTFTGCTRGVLNTMAVAHEVNADATADRKTSVDELVYLEMPAPKLVYALLTGDLYGQGATLPSTWHAGVHADYVRTASFVQIGVDLWDTTDDTKGLIVRFVGEKEQDVKKFIEKELLLLMGCYMPVHSDGALGLRRMTQILADAPHVKELGEDNLTSYSILSHKQLNVRNKINIGWNWEDGKDEFTRHSLLVDNDSIALYGASDAIDLNFRGLHGSRHTSRTILLMFERLRSRFSGEPLNISVTGFFLLNNIEIGDIVRLDISHIQDYIKDEALNRSFEVQQVSVDWFTGKVTLKLFGSTLKPEASVLSEAANVLSTAWYTGTGTNINTLTGYSAGALTTNVSVTGHASATNAAAIYYHDGDLTINTGVTLSISDNVQLRINGYLQVNGTIDGIGAGITTASTQGFVGTAKAQGGFNTLHPWEGGPVTGGVSNDVAVTGPVHSSVPELVELIFDSTSDVLNGLPSDLRGTTGSKGGDVYNTDTGGIQAVGGAHGNGGSGLLIICQGIGFGASGNINLSGDDGVAGATFPMASPWIGGAGGGAGGAGGALYVLLDGSASTATINTGNFISNRGASPVSVTPARTVTWGRYSASSYYVGFPAISSWQSNYLVQSIPSTEAAASDVPVDAETAASVTATELKNTPLSPAGNLSTLEITVTPPSDANYSHSMIYYRVTGNDVWSQVGVANDETVIVVASDGTAYDIEARAVSIWGVENLSGVSTSITTTDVTTPELNIDDPISDTLVVPDVSGLELFELGNVDVFTGKDAKFAWRKSSTTENYFIGSEPDGLGSDAGALDLFFLDYEVRMYDDNTLLRIENVTDNFYTYTFEKNAEDYERINNAAGAYRAFRIEVYARSRQGQYSANAAKLSVSNPAPALPAGINLSPNFRTLFLEYTLPTDLDFVGVKVWIGTTTGFTRDDTSLVHNGPETLVVIDKLGTGAALEPATTYYVYMLAYDAFGETGTESVELSTTTLQVATEDVELLAIDTPQIANFAVDAAKIELLAVATAHIANAAITNAKVNDLAVDKLTAGTISAAITMAKEFVLSTNGVVRSTSTFGNSGVWLGWDSTAHKFYVGDGANKFIKFDGSAYTVGADVDFDGADGYSTANNYIRAMKPHNLSYTRNASSSGTLTESNLYTQQELSAIGFEEISTTFNAYTLTSDWTWTKDRKFKVKLDVALANVGANYYFGIGVTDSAGTKSQFIGFRFEYVNGTQTKIYGRTCGSTSGSAVITDTYLADSSYGWDSFEFVHTYGVSSSTVDFYINGTLEGTISGNGFYIPNIGGSNADNVLFRLENTATTYCDAKVGEIRILEIT